ncbi:bystin-like isoform X1 [Miscanthus floridulus]|uniref:bystin-like isoform X1 n=1 Tax=Miscanthus floridulus TaxID=154761 RepID=UPI0034590B65
MAGKKRKSGSEKPAKHRLPLGADADAVADASKRRRSVAAKQHQEDEEASIPPSLSAKILREARKQQQEEMRADDSSDEQRPSAAEAAAGPSTSSSFPVPTVDGEEEEDDVDEFDGFDALSEYDGGEVEINEEDERALAAFMSKDKAAERTLGDIILQKIMEKDAEVATEGRPRVKLDNSIIELYKEYGTFLFLTFCNVNKHCIFLCSTEFFICRVGKFLSRYTSGKIPKAFKRIPSLECWADVVQLTEPENWSPNAVYQATRLFSSNMNTKNAERFYEAILLPRVRNDIRKNKRLHFALYQSLKKALYKPAAFNKGILLPLCRERNCTLREAVIIGSIIQKVSIPFLHASVALVKLSEMEYCGTTSYFIKLFLDKKYALPYRALDAVLAHFMRFLDDERIMPVIWHQSLLAFVERYKNELEKKDKEKLARLLDHQKHYLVTPEIRRELRGSCNRGEKDTNLQTLSPISVITKPIEEDKWDIPQVPMEED